VLIAKATTATNAATAMMATLPLLMVVILQSGCVP
jgi:hypothetical protein